MGTRKVGISESGKTVMSSFGASSANRCSGEGEVKNPVVTATTRSARPRAFQAQTVPRASRGLWTYAVATKGANSPTSTSPMPAGQANRPGSLFIASRMRKTAPRAR